MTDRIDLTENRDFRTSSEIVVNRIIYDEVTELSQEKSMSPEEFEKIHAWEQIFGRNYHYREDIEVFGMNDDEWRMEMKNHCQKCGKYFKIPWKKKNDLCPECNDTYLDILNGKMKEPWKQANRIGERYDDRDVLRLR